MSVLLSYCMIPFIKIFGFCTVAVRIPMVLASSVGIVLVYLVARKFFSVNWSLVVMAFAAINPWQFMQSRWSLDCNLFPHVFLLGFYLLLCGLEKRRYLYLSMVFFGLTFYCYGVAVYSVPVFLFTFAIWCLWKKEFSFCEILISSSIFVFVALPEILTMLINMFGLPTIETPLFTIPFFPESIRSTDILFLNFNFRQLAINILFLLSQVFLQKPDLLYNALPDFGPMYSVSSLFMCLGIILFVRRFQDPKEKASDTQSSRRKTLDFALLGFLFMGIWAGVMTAEVNINRISIIFYPLMFFTVYGIQTTIQCLPKDKILKRFTKKEALIRRILIVGFLVGYGALSVGFFTQYFKVFPMQIYTMFNADFLTIIKEADEQENYDTLYVTSDMGWQTNKLMSEILTQYSCRIDALYFQEKTNETGGRILLPYHERYHFVSSWREIPFDTNALYVIHRKDLDTIKADHAEGYDIVLEHGRFLAIDLK